MRLLQLLPQHGNELLSVGMPLVAILGSSISSTAVAAAAVVLCGSAQLTQLCLQMLLLCRSSSLLLPAALQLQAQRWKVARAWAI